MEKMTDLETAILVRARARDRVKAREMAKDQETMIDKNKRQD